jgi:hypothetical protein
MQEQGKGISWEIVHTTEGRIRVRIPQFKQNQGYADRFQRLVSLNYGVTEVRINAAAISAVISYNPAIVPEKLLQQQIANIIQLTGGIDPDGIDNVQSEPDVIPEVVEVEYVPLRINQRTLARRLRVSPSLLRQRRSRPDFTTWSRSKDPSGKGWKYKADSGYFYAAETSLKESD